MAKSGRIRRRHSGDSTTKATEISLPEDSTGSESDDAPEAVSLETGKRDAEGRESAVIEYRSSALQKQKELNRTREAASKAKAAERDPALGSKKRKKDGEGNGGAGGKRARANVVEESDEGEMEADDEGPEEGTDGFGTDLVGEGGDFSSQEEDDEEDISDSDSESDLSPRVTAHTRFPREIPAPSHLPDSIFAAAASAPRSTSGARDSQASYGAEDALPSRPKSKRRKKNTAKDQIIGTRTIRQISTLSKPSLDTTLPSASATSFMRNSLKGKKGRWERKRANIAMSAGRQGPALGFARSKK
ncbi:hypothetical protein BOTBODRAFT_193287 [Botryobasidium botryosum FD-172 SS1]|uniref:Uncharacterized protein n=1 Tax=Botryobasidium botryosum (strain FD-172 SS1) TaxID=930990 RepID=A0A067M1X5_BOTB1|nr:hypothetical protein BOTBODRAFT_193287 [Botryobasidium botryosum FD-172 SS1]